MSFKFLLKFQILCYVTFWFCDFFLILIFLFCHILSPFQIWVFEVSHNLSFQVMSHVEFFFLSQLEVLIFVKIWVFLLLKGPFFSKSPRPTDRQTDRPTDNYTSRAARGSWKYLSSRYTSWIQIVVCLAVMKFWLSGGTDCVDWR